MAIQLPLDRVFTAHEHHLDAQSLGRSNCAFDLRFRGMVPAHGVDCDSHHSGGIAGCRTGYILFLLDFDNLAAFILAAMRAGAMRQLLLVAVGALGEPWLLELVVRAAVAPAGG